MGPPTSGRRRLAGYVRFAALLTGAVCAAPPRSAGAVSAGPPPPREPCGGGASVFAEAAAVPGGAWDSHFHVTDPERFPVVAGAAYTPGVHTVWDNAVFERGLGCEHVVLVQPSVYGADNTLLLDSLRAYGPRRARAVVVLDAVAANNSAMLREWHGLGVRGARVNVWSYGGAAAAVDGLERRLRRSAAAVRPLGWVLQLYTPMDLIPSLVPLLEELDVRVVFDHLASPALPGNTRDLAGFDALVRLLGKGNTWVKVSGPYRSSQQLSDPEYPDLDPVIRELFRVAPSRLVYGSDWPHTRFEGLDIRPWTSHLLNLTGDDDVLRQKLFSDNARELWGA